MLCICGLLTQGACAKGSPVFYTLNSDSVDPSTNAPYPGSPLDAKCIAVHAYGGQTNRGTAMGPYGNPMDRYLKLINNDNLQLTDQIQYVPENPGETRDEM